jgi:hypothetical protein
MYAIRETKYTILDARRALPINSFRQGLAPL